MIVSTIMLVDDEVPFVEAMSKRMTKRGLNVISAHSGQDALNNLDSEIGAKVDVIILDVKMPGMNGLETLVGIKRKDPLVEVIMLTGHGTVESAIEGMKLGAYDFLLKPCDMNVLMTKIAEATEKKRRHETKIIEARANFIALRRGD